MLEAGIKPVYVFDGKPPSFKEGELAQRRARKEAAAEELRAATEAGDDEGMRKHSRRSASVTKKMNADAQRLLALMGCPVVLAPEEAEATCAHLVKSKLAYAAATDDMDVLTFGANVMVKVEIELLLLLLL